MSQKSQKGQDRTLTAHCDITQPELTQNRDSAIEPNRLSNEEELSAAPPACYGGLGWDAPFDADNDELGGAAPAPASRATAVAMVITSDAALGGLAIQRETITQSVGGALFGILMRFEQRDAAHTQLTGGEQEVSAARGALQIVEELARADAPTECSDELEAFVEWLRYRVASKRKREKQTGRLIPFDHPSGYCLTVARQLIGDARKHRWQCARQHEDEQQRDLRRNDIAHLREERRRQDEIEQRRAEEQADLETVLARETERLQDLAGLEADRQPSRPAPYAIPTRSPAGADHDGAESQHTRLAQRGEQQTAGPAPIGPLEPVEPLEGSEKADRDASPIWQLVRERLQRTIPNVELQTWLSGARLWTLADGAWALDVTTSAQRDVLHGRYRDRIEQALAEATRQQRLLRIRVRR